MLPRSIETLLRGGIMSDILESLPYILILGAAGAALAHLLNKACKL